MAKLQLKSKVFIFVILISLVACTFKKKSDPPNTLHLLSIAKIKGLDPIYSDDLYSGTEIGHVYEGLVQYHYLKRPYTLIPNLAEAMPEISKDGKKITFKIKKGVFFQDNPCFKATAGKGRELEAQDFVYSFKRLADPKLTSAGWWVFDGKILGLNEWREENTKNKTTDYQKEVQGLITPDKYTLQISLKQPSAQFIYSLAMAYSYAVPKEAVEYYGKEFINHPVGTGPFRLEEFNPSSKVVWIKNPTYRKEYYPSEGEPGDKEKDLLNDSGKPLPLSDKIIVYIFEESQPQWLSFLAGKLDYSGIPKDNFDSAITSTKELKSELKTKGIVIYKNANLEITHTSFNMEDPLIGKNKYLRQALSVAHNQEEYNKLFYNYRALSAQGPIPPGLAGYDPDFKNPYRQHNPEKAKELLKRAG
ncbi:MAG: hypothetical protein HY843_04615, partial [Bdellovibrio sp.]|nr:hypothetical protein [Bdellovibrio sp.]